MRQRIVVSGALAVVVVSVAACSMFKSAPKPPPAPVTVSAEQSGARVALASGQDLVVRLPSNPSTGYRWI
ncbi:MAG TPA: protease inhibitor I42 family protein [Methylomirabilota bacterium]